MDDGKGSNVAYQYGYMNMGYDVQIKRADG